MTTTWSNEINMVVLPSPMFDFITSGSVEWAAVSESESMFGSFWKGITGCGCRAGAMCDTNPTGVDVRFGEWLGMAV